MKLWAHQQQAVDIFSTRNSIGLWFDMGTGKTRTSVACYQKKAEQEPRHLRTLILSPKNVLENWKREFEQAKLGHKVMVLTGSGDSRVKQIKANTKCNIIVTNHEALGIVGLVSLLEKMPIDLIIVDEIHKFKNPNGVRTKILHRLSKKAKYRVGLTGTLILNSYADLYSPIKFLDPNLVAANFYAWQKQHFFNANAEKSWLNFPDYQPKPDSLVHFNKLIEATGLQVDKAKVLDLPPLVKTIIYVDLHEQVAKHYREMEKGFVTIFQDKDDKKDLVVAELVVTQLLRLTQITSGILKGEEEETVVENCKNEALMELLENITPKHKVIIWAHQRKAIEQIEKVCKAIHLKYCKVVGGQSVPGRQDQIDKFNNEPPYAVMIANQAAGGVGIGLQAASYMIYYSKTFNLEHDLQSEARAYRGGSEIHESITRIDLLTRGTIEEVIHQALEDKASMADLKARLKEKYGK